MLVAWKEATARLVALLVVPLSCAPTPLNPRDAADANDTGRTVDARTEAERALLQELASLPAGKAKLVGDVSVLAHAPYTAASGRTCRALEITPQPGGKGIGRLACSQDDKTWFFVPDVFGGDSTRVE
jgi:hypothetical protein